MSLIQNDRGGITHVPDRSHPGADQRCACCGEAEEAFLQLDHVENDGHLDRKAHKTSAKLFAVLKRLGWPRDRYQLLCANCNFGKLMNGGVCPHQQREAACA